MAWPDTAEQKSVQASSIQILKVPNPKAGRWFVAIRGTSRVNDEHDHSATGYGKNLGALNGIGYRLSLRFNDAPAATQVTSQPDPWCNKHLNALPDSEPESNGDEPSEPSQESREEVSEKKPSQKSGEATAEESTSKFEDESFQISPDASDNPSLAKDDASANDSASGG